MKDTMSSPFSFSKVGTESFNNKHEKIELVSCSSKNMICRDNLSFVNKCFVQSDQYFRDKEFQRSIETLKSAFYETTELNEPPCNKCAKLFRSTINETLENVHYELEKMTSGFFGNKSYKSNCQQAAMVLEEFKMLDLHESCKSKEESNQFLGDYLIKKVS